VTTRNLSNGRNN